jgi:predicted metal-dependent HD superfamily phosphohydrolase
VAPALPELFVSLRRNHQAALHDADSDFLVDLESGLLQPEAAQF